LEVAGNTFVRDSVGIGVANPQYKLDVGGRMRIQSKGNGNPFESAGVWFNSNTNNGSPAFLGMSNNNTIGLYGSGFQNWGFGMNTNTGNIGIGSGVFTPVQKLHVAGNTFITGNVGIGNADPTNKLDVAGNIVATGNIKAIGNIDIVIEYVSTSYNLRPSISLMINCECSAGKKVIAGGGGANVHNADQKFTTVNSSFPMNGGQGWTLLCTNTDVTNYHIITVWAICAKVL
jgi:hypothetical protein